MSSYYTWGTKQAEAQFDERVKLAKRGLDIDGWNVRVGGELIAEAVTRAQADEYMKAWRVKPCGCIQIYRADRPIEQRPAAWHKAPLPRPQSLRTSEVSRAKALAAVRVDRDIGYSVEPSTYSEQVFAVGAL